MRAGAVACDQLLPRLGRDRGRRGDEGDLAGEEPPVLAQSEGRRTGRSNALPVFQHGHVAAHPRGQILVDPRRGPADAVRHLGDDVAPRIDDHRMAVGEARLALALEVLAPRRRRGEPALGLDRSAADQRFPVVLAGGQGEGAGQEDQLGALFAQLPEQVREADVVADGAADLDAIGLDRSRPRRRRRSCCFRGSRCRRGRRCRTGASCGSGPVRCRRD